MTTLLSYIPIDRRQMTNLPDRTDGAALFADISGFTHLTNEFEKTFGPKIGAERFNRQINQLYDCLIHQVHAYQGSVIGFSGDAMTCWFADDAGGRAVSAALAMQEAMRQLHHIEVSPTHPVDLTIKIAIAVGSARRFRVGDPAVQYMDVVVGQTLVRMAAAEKKATKNQIVVSRELVANLGPALGAHALDDADYAIVQDYHLSLPRQGWPVSDPPSESEQALWVLPPVYDWLAHNRAEYLTQLRPVTALFLNFMGLDYDHDEAVGHKLDTYIQQIQQIATQAGGFLVQLTVGDKGSYLYVAFGAPVTRGDDPIRAVDAALAIRDLSHRTPFIERVSLGLSCGTMFTGAYGGQDRQTYGVLGSEVILSARLMSVAEAGQILITPHLKEQVADYFQLSNWGKRQLKGFDKPITIWQVQGHQPVIPNITLKSGNKFVGRHEELARLQTLSQQLPAKSGQLVLIEGEAGVGKSHLLLEFQRQTAHKLLILTGRCQVIQENSPWYPWQPIFRAIFGISPHTTFVKQMVEQTLNQYHPDLVARTPLLREVLGIALPDNELTAQFTPELRQQSLFSLLIEVLSYQIKKIAVPLCLIIEDIHWIDAMSLAFLKRLSRRLPNLGLLVVVSHRSSAGPTPAAELRQLPHSHQVTLSPLPTAEMSSLIVTQLPGQPSRLLNDVIQAKAQGNPFFTKTLIDFLHHQDWLQQSAVGVWQVRPQIETILKTAHCLTRDLETGEWRLVSVARLAQAPLELPDGVESLILARLDQLSETQRFTLSVASVVGPVFELALLQQTAILQHYPLATDLQTLIEQELIIQEQIQPAIYRFSHNRFQEVNYGTLTQRQRSNLHTEVGLALEQVVPQAVERLAYHFYHTELTDKKIQYIEQAARKAKQEFANLSARNYYQQLVELEARWAWRKNLIELWHLLGEKDKELAALTALTNQDLPLAEVAYLWGRYYESQSHYEAAHQAISRALGDYREQGDRPGQIACLSMLGRIARMQGDYQTAVAWYEQARQLFLETEYQTLFLDILNELQRLHTWQGNYNQARYWGEGVFALSLRQNDYLNQAKTLNNWGAMFFQRREFAEAEHYYEQALKLSRQTGDYMNEGVSLLGLGQVYCDTGRYDKAEQFLQQAGFIFQELNNIKEESNVLNTLGIVNLYLGQYSEARYCLEEFGRLCQQMQDTSGDYYRLCNLGQVVRDEGDYRAATAMLQQAIQAAQAQNDNYIVSICVSHLGLTALWAGDFELAIEYARQSIELHRQEDDLLWTTADHAVLAQAYAALGNEPEAIRQAKQALQILANCQAEGPEFPGRDYWMCYQVLHHVPAEQLLAMTALQQAYHLVQAQLDHISQPAVRRSFLENVSFNREIVAEAKAVLKEARG